MARQAYPSTIRSRSVCLALLSTASLLACASPSTDNSGSAGSSGTSNSGKGGSAASGARGGSTTGTGTAASGGQAPSSGTGGVSPTGSGGSTSSPTGSGGSTSSPTGSGGSTSSPTGSGGGAASPGTAQALSCTDSIYGSVSIPAVNVISDFETGSLLQYVQDGRGQGALPWYGYGVGDVDDQYGIAQTYSIVDPMNSANHFAVDSTQHGPCSSKGALRVSSPGKAGMGSYAGFGIDFMARTPTTKKKLTYDASKYSGIGFWAKCDADLQFAYIKLVDAAEDADVDTSVMPTPCSYTTNTCNAYGVKNAAITTTWSYYKAYFSEALQDPNGSAFGSGVDKTKLTGFQIYVNPFSPRTGTPSANPFNCYIDDVHFLSDAAPAVPAATVTWSTSGNKILRNGTAYKIRGLARASMEWDCAGFAITREDIARMKSWHANTVRLAVLDTLWNGGTTGSATCNGGAYQREVKRVIGWILEQGMDVILDLHYVGGTPTAANATFWSTISKDSFFKDGRVIYELYNEPTADIGTLRTWMSSTIASVRANGANNLILVSGPDYTYDLSGYAANPITGMGAVAYVAHPYTFKTEESATMAYLSPAMTLPVVATEFGDANVPGLNSIPATQCTASIYSTYISQFESAGISWTAFAWIVDEWGCGFPQLISDYSGASNAIGAPVQQALMMANP
jgi:cellulase (glycosyl hydrolase family 5)